MSNFSIFCFFIVCDLSRDELKNAINFNETRFVDGVHVLQTNEFIVLVSCVLNRFRDSKKQPKCDSEIEDFGFLTPTTSSNFTTRSLLGSAG